MEEEDVKVDDWIKDRKLIVLESRLMTLFRSCYSCGLQVKLEIFIVGTLLVVNGTYVLVDMCYIGNHSQW